MKTKLAACLFACVAMICIAATNTPGPFELLQTNQVASTNVPIHVAPIVQQPEPVSSQLLVLLIPVIVPLLLDYLKTKAPNIPSVALPALAPVLGAAADLCLQAANVQTGGVLKGAGWGFAGVGLRELGNQIVKWRQAQASGAPVPTPTPPSPKPADPLAQPQKPA